MFSLTSGGEHCPPESLRTHTPLGFWKTQFFWQMVFACHYVAIMFHIVTRLTYNLLLKCVGSCIPLKQHPKMCRVPPHFRENNRHSRKGPICQNAAIEMMRQGHPCACPHDTQELPKICLNTSMEEALEGTVTVHTSEDFILPCSFL